MTPWAWLAVGIAVGAALSVALLLVAGGREADRVESRWWEQ